MSTIEAHLPVAESIGFIGYLRGETSDKTFPQCSFSHWAIINDNPLVKGTVSNQIVRLLERERRVTKSF